MRLLPLDLDNNPDYTPERRLLAAVLARAIFDLCGGAPVQSHWVRSAYAWVYRKSRSKRGEISFEYCCANLDLDHFWMRDKITYLINQQIKLENPRDNNHAPYRPRRSRA